MAAEKRPQAVLPGGGSLRLVLARRGTRENPAGPGRLPRSPSRAARVGQLELFGWRLIPDLVVRRLRTSPRKTESLVAPEKLYNLEGKRVWVAGHRGMVGSALLRRLKRENCELLTVERDRLDLTRQAHVEDW